MESPMIETTVAARALKESLLAVWLLVSETVVSWDGKKDLSHQVRSALSRSHKEVALALTGLGAAGGAAAAVAAWQSSLGVLATVGVWLGVVTMPGWIPVAGMIAGGGATFGGAAFLVTTMRRRHSFKVAHLKAQTRSTVAFQLLREEEARAALEPLIGILVHGGTSKSDVVRWLVDEPVRAVEDLTVVPSAYTLDERREALIEAWFFWRSLSRDHRDAQPLHDRLCLWLGLADERTTLRAEADRAFSAVSAEAGALFEAVRALVAMPDSPSLDAVLAPVLAMDPDPLSRERRRRSSRNGVGVASAANTATALHYGRASGMRLIALAYTAARNAVESDGRADAATRDALHVATHELSRLLDLEPGHVTRLMSAVDAGVATHEAR